MSTCFFTSVRSERPKAPAKTTPPSARSDMVMTMIAANDRKPFLQKFTKPVFMMRLIAVKNMMVWLEDIFAVLVVLYDLALVHGYDAATDCVHHTLVVSGEEDRRAELVDLLE